MSKHTMKHLYELQALPLSLKVRLTKQRIREWVSHYGEDGVKNALLATANRLFEEQNNENES